MDEQKTNIEEDERRKEELPTKKKQKYNKGLGRKGGRNGGGRRNCIFGGRASRDGTKDNSNIALVKQCSTRGMICYDCSKFACFVCLESICSKMTSTHIQRDRWCASVSEVFELGYHKGPSRHFKGSCCEYREICKSKDNPGDIPSNVSVSLQNVRGDLCLPEYCIRLPSNFKCVDIHVFGPCSKSELPGVYHANVDREFNHIKPLGIPEEVATQGTLQGAKLVCPSILYDVHVADLPSFSELIPNALIFGKETIRVKEYYFQKVAQFDEKRKGEYPTEEEIGLCASVSFSDMDKRVDVLLMLGETDPKSNICHVLCAKFFHSTPSVNMGGKKLDRFNAMLRSKTKKASGGFMAKRTGGSNGKVSFNNDMKRFVHHASNLPNRGIACKFVNMGLHWDVFYISPLTGNPVLFSGYSQPRPGGNFQVDPVECAEFPFLHEFALTKVAAGLLFHGINSTRDLKIQPQAVAHQQAEISRVCEHLYTQGTLTLENLVLRLCNTWRYTRNNYPVAYHVDNFSEAGVPRIENKICFVDPSIHSSCGVGRGGCGSKNVYSLMIW